MDNKIQMGEGRNRMDRKNQSEARFDAVTIGSVIGGVVSAATSIGSSVDRNQRANAEARKRKQMETAMQAAKNKKDQEDAAALDEEKKRKARYGSNVPMTEYLGANQSGVRKTLLGG